MEQGPTMTIRRSSWRVRMRMISSRARPTTREPVSPSGSSSSRMARGSRGRMLSMRRVRVFTVPLILGPRHGGRSAVAAFKPAIGQNSQRGLKQPGEDGQLQRAADHHNGKGPSAELYGSRPELEISGYLELVENRARSQSGPSPGAENHHTTF